LTIDFDQAKFDYLGK